MANPVGLSRFGVREVANVSFINLATGQPAFYLDSLKISDLTIQAKTVYAVGGQGGNRLLAFDYGREVTLDIQDALLNPLAVAALTGNALSQGTQTVWKRDAGVTVLGTGGTPPVIFNLSETPLSTSTNFTVFTSVSGYDQTLVPSSSYTVSGKTITFTGGSGITAGTNVIVYYQFTSTGNGDTLIQLTANNFPGYYQVIGDTVVTDNATGNIVPYQFIIAKAKLQPNFKISLQAEANQPTAFDFKLDCLKPNNSNLMVSLIQYTN
jgi:hypothetical protein